MMYISVQRRAGKIGGNGAKPAVMCPERGQTDPKARYAVSTRDESTAKMNKAEA